MVLEIVANFLHKRPKLGEICMFLCENDLSKGRDYRFYNQIRQRTICKFFEKNGIKEKKRKKEKKSSLPKL
jgi:hypothetical protein